tara:strand:- start:203 stop:376 length:174 start_codon:yes stop_codon:yes gene_type:complete
MAAEIPAERKINPTSWGQFIFSWVPDNNNADKKYTVLMPKPSFSWREVYIFNLSATP